MRFGIILTTPKKRVRKCKFINVVAWKVLDLFINVLMKKMLSKNLELLHGTSLVNIHVNEENREDINGILQISFKK